MSPSLVEANTWYSTRRQVSTIFLLKSNIVFLLRMCRGNCADQMATRQSSNAETTGWTGESGHLVRPRNTEAVFKRERGSPRSGPRRTSPGSEKTHTACLQGAPPSRPDSPVSSGWQHVCNSATLVVWSDAQKKQALTHTEPVFVFFQLQIMN